MTVVYTFFETMDELRSVLTVEEVASFEKEWEKLDPDGTGYIGVWKLSALMERCKISTIKCHIIFFPLLMKMRFVESRVPTFKISTPLFTQECADDFFEIIFLKKKSYPDHSTVRDASPVVRPGKISGQA